MVSGALDQCLDQVSIVGQKCLAKLKDLYEMALPMVQSGLERSRMMLVDMQSLLL